MVCSAEIFASLQSNVVYRAAAGGCLVLRRLYVYKCGFRRRMSNGGPRTRVPLYQTSCVRVRNFRSAEFLFNSHESNRRSPQAFVSPPPPPLSLPRKPPREIALTFLMEWPASYFNVSFKFPYTGKVPERFALFVRV